jgi:hypothetical protein
MAIRHIRANLRVRISISCAVSFRSAARQCVQGSGQTLQFGRSHFEALDQLRGGAAGAGSVAEYSGKVQEERDTSAAAGEAQRAVFRRLAPSERVALALQMSEEARALAAGGLRRRRPDASDAEIEATLRRIMLAGNWPERLDRPRWSEVISRSS